MIRELFLSAASRPSSSHSLSRAAAGRGRRPPTARRSSGSPATGAARSSSTPTSPQGRPCSGRSSPSRRCRRATAAASCSRSRESTGARGATEDWFWFVNGLAGDRSATSYRLRDGDVAWWDYRDWSSDAATLEVVAGAFPEPFLHGYDGKRRPAAVRYAPGLRAGPSRSPRRSARTMSRPSAPPCPRPPTCSSSSPERRT